MMHQKQSDRIFIRTFRRIVEVKGEIYRGFGINEELHCNGYGIWNLTILEGREAGVAIVSYTKKKDCKKLADELLKIFNRADLTGDEVRPYKELVEKCGIRV